MSTAYKSFYDEIGEGDHRFGVVLFKLSNAVLVFYYENGDMKLGTLAIAMPQFGGKTCISSNLLGVRNIVITKILAERVSRAFKGIALVSTHLAEIREAKVSSTIMKLTQSLLDKADLK